MAQYAKKRREKDPSYKRMKADYFPVQRTIPLGMGVGPSAGDLNVIDVGANLSNMNHRLYRQGKMYQVKLDLENNSPTAGDYEVYALADTWYVQKAWQMAMSSYIDATAEERELLSSQKLARWEDFRVGAGVGLANTLYPYRYDSILTGALDNNGEFELSRVTLADGTQRVYSWARAPGAGAWSIIAEYDVAGNTDAEPSSTSADNPYDGLQADVHESQMDDLVGKGNQPPYSQTSFGGQWVKVATLSNNGTGSQRLTTGYFNAPCGLVVVKAPSPALTINGELSMTVKAGQYKGTAGFNMG
jgi:hypothetical protein